MRVTVGRLGQSSLFQMCILSFFLAHYGFSVPELIIADFYIKVSDPKCF